jgi:ER lumen protein retaining receptor
LLHFKTPVNLVTLICCSAYRALYILNWVYRYFTEPHYVHWISMSSSVQSHVHLEAYPYKKNLLIFRCLNFIAAWIAGTVQTLLYADFFYYYFQRLVFKL